jgi:N-acylglucosamine 2-epimerase (GlcNAc 2-epimerase)
MLTEHGRPERWVGRRDALGLLAMGTLALVPNAALAAAKGSDGAAVVILEKLLEHNLLSFWRQVANLPSVEGYELHIDDAGQWLQPQNRLIIPQARTTWSFARLARSKWGRPADLAIAQHGFDYLTQRMWDRKYGGFFWEVGWTDQLPTKPDKYLNGQAHALLALSEYALTSRSATARVWAERVADAIDDHLSDPGDAGNYVDFRLRDWSAPPPDQPGYNGLLPHVRAYNARFRLLDARTAYYRLVRTNKARDRLSQAVSLAERALVTEPAFYFGATDPAPSVPRVSYATDLQTIHQLRRARTALGLAEPSSYQHVIDSVLRWGEDHDAGGFYEAGNPGQPSDQPFKDAWVQAEGLWGTCDSWVRSGNVAHRAAFWRTLLWIARRQADWAQGEWYYALGDGAPTGTKEAPFHTIRAVLYALELLQGRVHG